MCKEIKVNGCNLLNVLARCMYVSIADLIHSTHSVVACMALDHGRMGSLVHACITSWHSPAFHLFAVDCLQMLESDEWEPRFGWQDFDPQVDALPDIACLCFCWHSLLLMQVDAMCGISMTSCLPTSIDSAELSMYTHCSSFVSWHP